MDSTTQIYLQMTLESGLLVFGESSAGGYESRIDLDSFEFHASAKKQSLKEVQKDDVSANLDFNQLTISKVFDRSSLLLAGVLNRHERFKEVKIAVDQQYIHSAVGKERNETLIINLKSGYIADFQLRTSEGEKSASIKERITLSFHNISIRYYAYDGLETTGGKQLGSDYRMETWPFETQRDEQGD
jgi:type VI protein secretion system component Hcp